MYKCDKRQQQQQPTAKAAKNTSFLIVFPVPLFKAICDFCFYDAIIGTVDK